MTRYARLRKEALESARFRGHDMAHFVVGTHVKLEGEPDAIRAYSECKNCDMQIAIVTCPMPNEIDVGGEAVALNCRGGSWSVPQKRVGFGR